MENLRACVSFCLYELSNEYLILVGTLTLTREKYLAQLNYHFGERKQQQATPHPAFGPRSVTIRTHVIRALACIKVTRLCCVIYVCTVCLMQRPPINKRWIWSERIEGLFRPGSLIPLLHPRTLPFFYDAGHGFSFILLTHIYMNIIYVYCQQVSRLMRERNFSTRILVSPFGILVGRDAARARARKAWREESPGHQSLCGVSIFQRNNSHDATPYKQQPQHTLLSLLLSFFPSRIQGPILAYLVFAHIWTY